MWFTGRVLYLHHDQLGSVVATSDTNGDMVNSYAYSPWGYCTNMAGTTFGFTGQRFDSETGLYYYKNRYFSPAIGRFLQPDPTGYDDDLNLYAYVGNSPLNFTDPLGLARVALAKYSNDGWNNSLVIPNNNKGTAIFTNSVFDLYKGPSLNGPVLNGSTGIIFNPGNCGCGCGECGGEGGGGGIASYPTNFNSPQANPTGNTPTSNASDDLDDYYNCIITCVGFTAPLAISTCALLSGGVLPAFVTCLAIAAAPAYAACLVFCGPKPPGKKLQKCSRYYIC
ncbi:MAG: RHS repeat-associated core domain-containing protein [Cyanobacteriota/Melainabacteria group bacterium]